MPVCVCGRPVSGALAAVVSSGQVQAGTQANTLLGAISHPLAAPTPRPPCTSAPLPFKGSQPPLLFAAILPPPLHFAPPEPAPHTLASTNLPPCLPAQRSNNPSNAHHNPLIRPAHTQSGQVRVRLQGGSVGRDCLRGRGELREDGLMGLGCVVVRGALV